MPRYLDRDRIAILAALILPLAVSLAFVPFRASHQNTNVALIMVVIVVAVAANGHRLAGALTAVSAAVWFDFFFTQPYQRFAISKAADIQTALLLLVVGVAVSQLAARARRLRLIAITDANYLAQIHATAELAESSKSADPVIALVTNQLTGLLGLRGCRFEYGTLIGHPPRLEQDGSVVWDRKRLDVDRVGLPDREIELRTIGNGHFYGRFMLDPTPGNIPSLQARLVAVILADQVGAALDTAGNR
ncbi:DUF4118 domain-containing protein [Nonomuraea sp. bgisy101]|uniref:DUF4118 domain-containing protein n=1 Tax=Nonomuraea sp. bgisy101 TaxID=3413784 RepID=UPI003D748E81